MSSMNRREFLQMLAAASVAGAALDARPLLAAGKGDALYDLPKFGNVHFMHFTDCHAQLLPIWFREPSVNLGVGGALGKAPHLVGEHLLKAYVKDHGRHRRSGEKSVKLWQGKRKAAKTAKLQPQMKLSDAPKEPDVEKV